MLIFVFYFVGQAFNFLVTVAFSGSQKNVEAVSHLVGNSSGVLIGVVT